MDSEYRSIFDALPDGLIIINLETGLVVEANPAACVQHGCTREEIIGQQLAVFIHPSSQKALDEYILSILPGGVFNALLLHTRQNRDNFYAEWRGKTIDYQNQSSLLGIVRDVSKKVRSDLLVSRRIDTREHEQDSLLAISHTLASTLELQPGLILDQLWGIIEYNHGCIFIVEDSSLISLAVRGTPQLEQSPTLQIRLQGQEALEKLLNEHRAIRVADLLSDNSQAIFFRELLDEGAAEVKVGIRSWMWIPLAVKDRLIGGLGLGHKTANYFTHHQSLTAQSVANLVALTLVNAEFHEQAQAFAILEERQRLARNLHDAINQSLFTAGIIAEVLPRLWEQDQDLARESLKDLHRLTRSAQAEMRALLAELRPATLTDTDLGELIRLLGYALSGRIDIPVIVNTTEDNNLPAEVQIAFYRVCQEGLNNIAKHANASRVDIDLQKSGAEIELRICDNGQGFDPTQTISGHYGMQMMRERSDEVGAQLTVSSQPGLGTELTIRWDGSTPKEGR